MKKILLFFLFLNLSLYSRDNPYKIETGDVLEILVIGEENLSRTVMVMRNGMISFPLIGEVKVAGLTPEEASNLISEKLSKYFTHPLVSVILKSPSFPYVSVFGAVLKPGAVEYQRGLKLTDYIALAGGPTPKANLKKVRVVIFREQNPISLEVNVDEILKRGDFTKNMELKPGDVVYVPEKFTINWGIVLNALALTAAVLNFYITLQRTK